MIIAITIGLPVVMAIKNRPEAVSRNLLSLEFHKLFSRVTLKRRLTNEFFFQFNNLSIDFLVIEAPFA